MKTIGNVLWFLFAGLWLGIGYMIAGVINCLLVVTIPFGIASFRLARYAFWPFGREVVNRERRIGFWVSAGNVIWFLVSGLWLAIGHVLVGALLCATIVGIPFGIVSFRMATLALAPLGKEVVPKRGAPQI
ncbi:MAG: YccF domain-containing protein [Acidimicrobiia bacterium]|nr:YccF domain-containing protein [Acidimicrobiia bacterium]